MEQKQLHCETNSSSNSTKNKDNMICANIPDELKSFYILILRGFEMFIKEPPKCNKWKKRILYLGTDGAECPKLIFEKCKTIQHTGNENGILLQDIGNIYRNPNNYTDAIMHIIPHESAYENKKHYEIKFPTYSSCDSVIQKLSQLLNEMGIRIKNNYMEDIL